jgi:hypothetical protein
MSAGNFEILPMARSAFYGEVLVLGPKAEGQLAKEILS